MSGDGTYSGIYTLSEFRGREVLKLAPDAFIEINGSLETRIITSTSFSGKPTDFRSGVSSITTNMTNSSAGASTCTIDIVAPQFKGFHQDYYITLPSGVKIPFFIPMMEVKVFIKGRFLDEKTGMPKYYQSFWGFIKDIAENYTGGVTTFSLTCPDMLHWWSYQEINLIPGSSDHSYFGGGIIGSGGDVTTTFRRMNAFQIIIKLFTETGFSNFVVPQPQGAPHRPFPKDFASRAKQYGDLYTQVINYWSRKYFWTNGLGLDTRDDKGKLNITTQQADGQLASLSSYLEIYGFNGKTPLSRFVNGNNGSLTERMEASSVRSNISVDFSVFEKVTPFAAVENFSASSPTTASKLDIAIQVSDQIKFEFFLDTNGLFVFKPPLYNLDVRDSSIYSIDAKDILNFSAQTNSDEIVNLLEVTGPMVQETTAVQAGGFHVDFESIARFGLRRKKVNMMYGNTPKQLQQIAVAEMSRQNSKVFTASMTIPLRPEMRLGYPVYIKHLDAFYYVTGINHSINFGTSSETTLVLEAKRERIYTEDGTTIKKAHVHRLKKEVNPKLTTKDPLDSISELRKTRGFVSGMDTGYYEIVPALLDNYKSDALSDGENSTIYSTELVNITEETVPFSDRNGFRHIGGFPYGANLTLGGTKKDIQEVNYKKDDSEALFNMAAEGDLERDPGAILIDHLKVETTLGSSIYAEGDGKPTLRTNYKLPASSVFSGTTSGMSLKDKSSLIERGGSDALIGQVAVQKPDTGKVSYSLDNVELGTEGLVTFRPNSTGYLSPDLVAYSSLNAAPKE